MIDFAAVDSPSRARDREISALLARLSEIDPVRAVDYAQSAYLETRFVVQAFESLARVNVDQAISELARMSSAARQRKVALALLDLVLQEACTHLQPRFLATGEIWTGQFITA